MSIPTGKPVGEVKYSDRIYRDLLFRIDGIIHAARSLGVNPAILLDNLQDEIEGSKKLSIKEEVGLKGRIYKFGIDGDGVRFRVVGRTTPDFVEDCEVRCFDQELHFRDPRVSNAYERDYVHMNEHGPYPSGMSVEFRPSRAHLVEVVTNIPQIIHHEVGLDDIVSRYVGDDGTNCIEGFERATFADALICSYHVNDVPRYWRTFVHRMMGLPPNMILIRRPGALPFEVDQRNGAIVFPETVRYKNRAYYPGLMYLPARDSVKAIYPVLLDTDWCPCNTKLAIVVIKTTPN